MFRGFGTLCLLVLAASSGWAQPPADSTPRPVEILRRTPPVWVLPSPTLLNTELLAEGNEPRVLGASLVRPRFKDSFAAAVAIRLACGHDFLCASELESRYHAEYSADLPIGLALLSGLMAELIGAPEYRLGEAPVPSDTLHSRW